MLQDKSRTETVLLQIVGKETNKAFTALSQTLKDSDLQYAFCTFEDLSKYNHHSSKPTVVIIDLNHWHPTSKALSDILIQLPVIVIGESSKALKTLQKIQHGAIETWSSIHSMTAVEIEASVWKAIYRHRVERPTLIVDDLSPNLSTDECNATDDNLDATKEYSARRYQQLFLQAEKQTKELQLLDEVQTAIANQLDLDSLYDKIVETVSTILGYKLVMITLLGDGRIWRGPYRGYINANVPKNIAISEGLVGEAAITGKPILVKDVSKDERYYPISPGVLSNICIPFFDQEEVVGVLLVENQQERLDERDFSFLTKVAEQISLAVENTRLHEKNLNDLRRTQALYSISKSIQQTDDTQKMLQEIIRSTRDAVESRWAIIYKIDFDNKCIEYISKTEHETTPLQALNFDQLQTGLTGWAIRNREVVLSVDVKTDERENPIVRQTGGSLGSAIVAPLLERGIPIGTLAVVNDSDDAVFTEEDRELISTIANQSAVALTQHQLLKAIQHQAYHDSLTDLPNRTHLDSSLNKALDHAEKDNAQVAVIFVDLDGFKHVNDTLGHSVGDTLLIEVGHRFAAVTSPACTLARLGGDEFALILTGRDIAPEALELSSNILKSLETSFHIGRKSLQIGASIGISLYPNNATDAQGLLRIADSAMYQAKAKGKNNVQIFSPELAIKAQRRVQIESCLKSAIDNNEFFLVYQPQFELSQDSIVGFEALLRWKSPELGNVAPDEFIPIAEDSGMILPIGEWVLREACKQLSQWKNRNLTSVKMAVNLSSVQIERENFEHVVKSIIDQFGVEPSELELEVTESVVMCDISSVIERLNTLQSMGVQLAIDDFGTGYSSLRYLQQLPLNALKIDRSFVSQINSGDNHKTLIRSILGLADGLTLRTVAEGIETSDQLEYLKSIGCKHGQGYYFSKPLLPNEADKFLTSVEPTSISLVA